MEPSPPGTLLDVVGRLLARRRETNVLLEKTHQLRRELATQLQVVATARARARQLMSLAQVAHLQRIELEVGKVAPLPNDRRPHLVVLPGGG